MNRKFLEALRPLVDAWAELKIRVDEIREEAITAAREAAQSVKLPLTELMLAVERRMATVKDGRDGKDGAPGRDGKDGRDGNGIESVAHSDTAMTLEFSNGECAEIPLPVGRAGNDGRDGRDGRDGTDGVQGPPGTDGLPGIGLDAPCWAAGVYREGVIVQHYEGRIYRARKDTAEEPGDSQAWERIGRLGTRWCGPFEEARTYEAGDQYAKGGTFHVLANGEHRLLAAKPLAPSEVRASARKVFDEREAALRGDLAATQAELNRTKVELAQTRVEYSEALAAMRLEVEALKKSANVLRQALEDLAARGAP